VDLSTAMNIVEIIVSITLIVVILLQAKGSGLGTIFGGDSSAIYRTRRGLERRLYQFTIALAVAFVLLSLASSVVGTSS
jgi:preprotein translocase subunit SecG